MTEEMNDIIVIEPEAPDPNEIKAEKKAIRRGFSLCGWSTVILTAASFVVSYLAVLIIDLIYEKGIDSWSFYNKFPLYINELVIGLSIVIGMLILLRMPKAVPAKNKISVKAFLVITFICFFVGAVGNTVGTTLLTIWNVITGNDVTNELAEVLTGIGPLQMIICVVVLAPILEEFFFRKLLIDRMNRFGEFPAIFVSALFFGLFHQNFSQFFYAFMLGLVFGYVYCKTGSYLVTVGLHAIFNFIGGTIPSLLSTKLFEFSDKLIELGETENVDLLMSLFGEYAVPLLLYFFYLTIMAGLNITGLVLFIINVRKVRIEPHYSTLTLAERRKAIFLNVGMIVAIALFTVLMIRSLLPAGPLA